MFRALDYIYIYIYIYIFIYLLKYIDVDIYIHIYIYSSIDHISSTQLVSLDLSDAFDAIEHNILLNGRHTSFGITDTALACFRLYLSSRSQFVGISSSKWPTTHCTIGIPPGSVLGPILFSIYISPTTQIASSFDRDQ